MTLLLNIQVSFGFPYIIVLLKWYGSFIDIMTKNIQFTH